METEGVFIPRISCQACGESWALKEEILHDCTDQYECPDCDYRTVHPNGTEIRCGGNSGHGSPNSPGTAGAPGRLTHVSEILDPLQIDAFTTRGNGSILYRGLASGISWPSSVEPEGACILMVSFDSLTLRRLKEHLCGVPGKIATDVVACSPMTLSVAPRTT